MKRLKELVHCHLLSFTKELLVEFRGMIKKTHGEAREVVDLILER